VPVPVPVPVPDSAKPGTGTLTGTKNKVLRRVPVTRDGRRGEVFTELFGHPFPGMPEPLALYEGATPNRHYHPIDEELVYFQYGETHVVITTRRALRRCVINYSKDGNLGDLGVQLIHRQGPRVAVFTDKGEALVYSLRF
jgi:hypothetical protein